MALDTTEQQTKMEQVVDGPIQVRILRRVKKINKALRMIETRVQYCNEEIVKKFVASKVKQGRKATKKLKQISKTLRSTCFDGDNMTDQVKAKINVYLTIFEEKLKKIKKKIKQELEKEKDQRDADVLKRALKEAKSLKEAIKAAKEDVKDFECNCQSPLFHLGEWTMHSGGIAQYKIDCDALTDADMQCLAYIISQKGQFKEVYGVPTGGARLQQALEQYKSDQGIRLIVDDVLTTGASMEEARKTLGWSDAVGVVIFARSSCPDWIKPLFSMNWINTKDTF